MMLLRKILWPFSYLYGVIVSIRNIMYDKGFLKSTQFDMPIIVVGNLNVGGTGKSPMIEYLVRLLKDSYKVAVLSRGYKRKTKGFHLASKTTTVADIGDEPMQFFRKFKAITVAVSAKRVEGIEQLRNLKNPDVILLDDAYQHRQVQSKYNILLTAYYSLYTDDVMLPTGNLRESKRGAQRAKVIIVTKCPDDITKTEQQTIAKKLKTNASQDIYFTKIGYDDFVYNTMKKIKLSELQSYTILLITGIAKTSPLTDFLTTQNIRYKHLKYKDHYNFTTKDLEQIHQEYSKIVDKKKIVLTTEKDYVRTFEFSKINTFYLPIKTVFINSFSKEDEFKLKINEYVGQSTRNS